MSASRPSLHSPAGSTGTSQKVLLPVMLAALALLVGAYWWGLTGTLIQHRDRFLLDNYHVSGAKAPERPEIMVLGIDDASRKLDNLWPEDLEASPALRAMKDGGWPFPRKVWALLLDRLFDAGAKLVFLDLTFPKPDPDPENDRLLSEALERYRGRVIIAGKVDLAFGRGGGHAELTVPSASLGQEAQTSFAMVNFWNEDGDSVFRTLRAQFSLLQAEQMLAGRPVQPTPHDPPYSHVVRMMAERSGAVAPGTLPDLVRFRFAPAEAYTPGSLHEVFVDAMWTSNFDGGAAFKDKVVMVGAAAADMQDFLQSPLGRIEGVRMHAHALGAVMSGAFLHDAPWWWGWAGLAGGFGVAWFIMTFVRRPLVCVTCLVGLSAAAFYGGAWAFDRLSVEASPLPAMLALNVCGLAGLTGNFVVKMRETQKLQRFLARYTSPELAMEMMRDRQGVYTTLRGTKRTVTVLFSDVRGFTSMSESMEPTQMVEQLNEYLSRMVETVIRHKGLVDKFIGDAVMALWGSMRSQQGDEGDRQDAIRAVQAALKMRTELAELNARWQDRGITGFQFGIGIHQGVVVAGNIGSEAPYEKMDITVIGDSVNLASRLEGVTKEYGVDLIISEAVRRWLGDDFVVRSADLVKVKGKLRPTEVFAVISMREKDLPPGLTAFENGVRAYREGRFTEALADFLAAAGAGLDDALTRMYRERCETLITHPPGDWDGTYTMTKK